MDLDAVCTTAATTLARTVATDGWEQVRLRLARLLGRDSRRREAQALTELDHVTKTDARAVSLRRLLRSYLDEHPELASELDALAKGVAARLQAQTETRVLNGRADNGGVVVQAGGDVTFGTAGRSARRR